MKSIDYTPDYTTCDMYRARYIAFMTDPRNIRNCASCPENCGAKCWEPDFRLPCGQQNCVVRLTCRAYGTDK